jgi:hypothetical protein
MTDDEWREWTREHRARYEVRPLLAMQRDQQVQIGFEVELAASLPARTTPGESREPAIRSVMTTLGDLATLVLPAEGTLARSDLAPSRGLVQLSKEPEEISFRPEVRRAVKIVHRDDVWRPVEEGERELLVPFERRFKELGVRSFQGGT